MKELLRDVKSLLRDFELYKTSKMRSLPILDRDIVLLKTVIDSLDNNKNDL